MTTNRLQSVNGSFLRDDSKNWIGSSLFFMSIDKLGIGVEKYFMPTGMEFTNEQLSYYVEHLLDEVASIELDDKEVIRYQYYEYVKKVVFVLRTWARAGHGIRVV